MAIPTMEEPLEVLNNCKWHEQFDFFDESEQDPEDLSGLLIRAGIRTLDGQLALSLSTADGTIDFVDANTILFDVPETTMKTIEPGLYDFDILVTRAGGHVEALLRGSVRVLQGATAA